MTNRGIPRSGPTLPGIDRASKPTRLALAVFLRGLVATWLLVPPAAAQETPLRTLRASAEPIISIGPGQGVDSPYELFQVDGAMRLPDGSVVVMVRGHHEVRRFGPDGIRWDGPGLEVTDEHRDAYRDELYEAYRRGGRDDWEQRFNAVWESEGPHLPNRFPAYDDVMIANGLIWVRHFRPPGQAQQHWWGFDDDGTHVATVSLPGLMQVQDLGFDWVLGVVTDRLGIERLVVHQLEGNEP